MTNLQQGAPRLTPRQLERLWLTAPIALGGGLAVLLAALVFTPLWMGLQRDGRRLRDLQELRDQVSQMRRQLSVLDVEEEKATVQQARLFEMVAGGGDLSTLLAALDEEARGAGVRLELYEPQPETPPEAGKPGSQPPGAQGRQGRGATPRRQGEPPPPAGRPGAVDATPGSADALAVEGLRRNPLLVSAKGSFPALLRFLRGLEQRSVLVVQSDLQLALEEVKATDPKTPPPPPEVVLRLATSLYDRPSVGEVAPGSATRTAPPPPAMPGTPGARRSPPNT